MSMDADILRGVEADAGNRGADDASYAVDDGPVDLRVLYRRAERGAKEYSSTRQALDCAGRCAFRDAYIAGYVGEFGTR